MRRKDLKLRLLGRQIWCAFCIERVTLPREVSDFLIPARTHHYDLMPDGSRDFRVIGVCKGCLEERSEFQKSNAQTVDANHKHLIYKNV